jgi:hypothetical protein
MTAGSVVFAIGPPVQAFHTLMLTPSRKKP